MEVIFMTKRDTKSRTERLREQMINFIPRLCPERIRIYTRVFKETETEVMIIRRAKALAKVLEEMTIYILDDELIVGNQASTPVSAPIFPETEGVYAKKTIDYIETRAQDPFLVSKAAKKEIQELLNYWQGKVLEEHVISQLFEEARNLVNREAKVINPEIHLRGGIGHFIPEYRKILSIGFQGIIDEVSEKLKKLEYSNPEDIDKINFYKAVQIVSKGICRFAERFSELAAKMSEKAENKGKAKDLKEISKICNRVPRYSARNFHEALQSIWFQQVVIQIESNGLGVSPGRIDQLLWPYYVKEKELCKFNKPRLQEIIDSYWIKIEEIKRLYDDDCARYFAGYTTELNNSIGGVTRDGQDATNELSYMFLDAEKRIGLAHPNITVRLHKDTPEEFLIKTLEVVRLGRGKPQFANDESSIPSMLNRGVSLEDARDYGFVGCVEPGAQGSYYGWSNGSMFNLGKCLELALNNGVCMLSGEKIGPSTGNPEDFKNLEEVISAYKQQVAYFVKKMVEILNVIDICHRNLCPIPYASILVNDCLEKGIEASAGGARYSFTGVQGVGVSDVADSLSVIQTLVFEQNQMTMGELLKIVKENFEGHEAFRKSLFEKIPRYGNDDDRVDLIAREVARIYCKEVEKYHNPRGGQFHPGLYPVSAHVPMGHSVSALPSGKKSRAPLADGLSPTHGSDRNGPTAIIKSVAKIDHILASNGTLLNQKFLPSSVQTERDLYKWAHLIKTFFDLKGNHVQFNIIDTATLRSAQKNPEQYRSLVVRVAGYSAFFVQLDKEIQNDIIERTELSLV
jgi:formate C-acetyltransferase